MAATSPPLVSVEGGPPIPPYLFQYLSESPLPVALFCHQTILASAPSASTPLPECPIPFFQNAALEAFLYQGAGGAALLAQQQLRLRSKGAQGSKVDKEKEKAKEKAIRAARAVAPKDLTHALDEQSREPFRRWLVEGVNSALQHAAAAGAGEQTASSPAGSSVGAASSTPSSSQGHSFPFSSSSASPSPSPSTFSTSSAQPIASSTTPTAASSYIPHRPSGPRSIASSRGTHNSFYSAGNASGQPYRQIGLMLNSQISFAKIHYRAQVITECGFTVLTQLPATGIANGGQMSTSTGDESGSTTGGGSWSGTTAAGSSSAGGNDSTLSSFSRALTSLSLAAASGGITGVKQARDGALEGVQEEDGAGEDGASLAASEPAELLGDTEVSCEGARDATSLEGLGFTLWNAPVGLFRVNTDLSITQANPAWRRVCGLQPGETNDAWGARVHPDDRDRVISHYRKLVAELPLHRDECTFRWLPENDTEQWTCCIMEPAIINGRLEGYCGLTENINKHKAAETASELRERELRAELAVLSDSSMVGLVRIDLNGHFISANPAWYPLVKLEPGRPLDEWVNSMHEDDKERVMSEWAQALKTLTPLTIRFRWRDDDVCLVQAQPNSRDPAEATGWIGAVTNITAQAKAEEAILNLSKEREARANTEAKAAEERRKEAVEEKRQQELLIDVTSHEIRNPISAILQNADFTRSSLQGLRKILLELKEASALPSQLDGKLLDDLEEDIEALDSITECGLAQERIANDILGLAQIQLSKYSITPVEFDLATSLRNICRMFKSECRSKGVELRLVIGSSLARLGSRARVFADPARLTQVLVNLLSNAIRFTSASTTVREVTLAVEVSGKPPDRDTPLIPPVETETRIDEQKPVYLFFSVEDTGPGMTQAQCGNLFKKFMQASPFTHTTWGGSGLGLWIARNLCELQAGRIEVASTVGKGSIFRCFITARSVDAGLPEGHHKPVAVIEGITAPNAARGAAPTVYLARPGEKNTPLNGLTILCCEDNQINRTVLKRQLTKEGCEDILLACDGQEGLDLFFSRGAGEIDCILMDIEMPVMDGLAATRAIRQAEKDGPRAGQKRQRIIGLTGNARGAQKDAALEAGMDTVVTKPYKVPDLIEKIRSSSAPGAVVGSKSLVPDYPQDVTIMAASAGLAEQTFKLDSGQRVEVITSGSPTSSTSSKLRGEGDRTSPQQHQRPQGLSREFSSTSSSGTPVVDEQAAVAKTEMLAKHAEEAADSMEHHGAGDMFPRSQDPERRLMK